MHFCIRFFIFEWWPWVARNSSFHDPVNIYYKIVDIAVTFWEEAALEIKLKKREENLLLRHLNPENSDIHVRIKISPSSSDPKVPNFRQRGFTPETRKK